MQTGPGDNEIIDRVLRGEQALYAHLVKRYQNFVFTIVLRYTTSREDAEEISQDVTYHKIFQQQARLIVEFLWVGYPKRKVHIWWYK